MDKRLQSQAPAKPLPPPPTGSTIMLCSDGTYRWTYEFSMYKNPTILFTLWKVMGLSCGIIWLFTAVVSLFENGFDAQDQLKLAGVFLLIFAGVGIVIGGLAYLIVAAMNGGKYCVVFEMDDKGVRHNQMPKQFKKAQILAAITSLVGAGQGNFSMLGAGLLAASRNSLYTGFAKVRGGSVARKRDTIYLNERLNRNQIYAEQQDFDFVLRFIRSRVPAEVATKLQD